MQKIKVLLGDPRHSTRGTHSSYVPIGIGYIGEFLISELKDSNIELKLATEPEEIFDLLKDWKPNVIGLSNYVWNAALSYSICKYAKKINPDVLTILGGPQFPAGTGARKIQNNPNDLTYDKSLNYLINRPSVDYYAYNDGEVVFLEIIKKFIEKNLSVKELKNKDIAINGCASISKDGSKLFVGDYIARIGLHGSVKAQGRDIIPSPYLSGLLDKFLDGTFVPAFETARGCPFMCTFCDQGLEENKITTFSVERLAKEMWYVGEKMSKIKNGTKTIYIFDDNWGLFEKDAELADHILKVMEKYDWPQYISTHTPKSNWDRYIKINDKLKNRCEMGISMQSLSDTTLNNIKRNNWTRQQYIDYTKEIHKRGKPSTTEIIVPLPGETEESYFEGMKFLMDNNITAGTYTTMMLVGAELGRDAAIKKYDMKSKFRILPKQFSEYHGEKIFEIEKCCVSTNTMNFQSYLSCRNYSFIVHLIGHAVFKPIYKLTQKLGINWYDFSREVTNTIQDKNFKGKFKDIYNEFCKESLDELFDSEQEAIDFYSKPENYKRLINGDVGENLIGKYTARGLYFYDDVLTAIFQVIRKKCNGAYDEKLSTILNSSEKWLRNIYMLNEIFKDKKEIDTKNNYKINMDFDFPSWLSKSDLPFNQFRQHTTYEFNYDLNKLKYLRNEIDAISGKHKVKDFTRYVMLFMSMGAGVLEKNFQKLN